MSPSVVLFALVLAASPQKASPQKQPGTSAASATTQAPLSKAKPSFVCMVNDRYMGKEQIPVTVNGKTYYGCCKMCEEKLAKDTAVRSAVDPVSGKTVDKAKAVIGRASSDEVLYFESQANLDKHNARR
jgi:YHS domain-containing protein